MRLLLILMLILPVNGWAAESCFKGPGFYRTSTDEHRCLEKKIDHIANALESIAEALKERRE